MINIHHWQIQECFFLYATKSYYYQKIIAIIYFIQTTFFKITGWEVHNKFIANIYVYNYKIIYQLNRQSLLYGAKCDSCTMCLAASLQSLVNKLLPTPTVT